ncbi:MAG: hypothetical protein L0Y73_09380, partial [Candidatus Aminicenantes bacterium]|nr:hypothetical protein [Candidatus Aminicenantes bacterium]
MITKDNFKPGDIRPGVNVNGIFACELSRAEFLEKSKKLIEDLAFKGIEYAGIWMPWPLAAFDKYSKIMQERMIFMPYRQGKTPGTDCDYKINVDFLEKELLPIVKAMVDTAITPVLNVGGYSRSQAAHPVKYPIKKGCLYSDESYATLKKIMAAIKQTCGINLMKKMIFKSGNEPYAFPAPRNVSHKQAVEIIYEMTRCAVRFREESMKLYGLHEENFAFDITYGYDRETGKQWPIHNAGMVLGHCRKKYNVLKQSIEEIEDIEKKEVKMVDTYSLFEFHQVGGINSVQGRTGNMDENTDFTGVMCPVGKGTGQKYIRKAHIFYLSADGFKPRLTGRALDEAVYGICVAAKKQNDDRAIVHFSHPVGQYKIPSKNEYTHRWTFDKFDLENEVEPALKAMLRAGIKLP